MKRLALRKVKARLLKLNDIFDEDNSDSDSSESMKAPQFSDSNLPVNVPPPIPQNLPPMPQQVLPPKTPGISQPAAQAPLAKPKVK
jgi:hypothetical protein